MKKTLTLPSFSFAFAVLMASTIALSCSSKPEVVQKVSRTAEASTQVAPVNSSPQKAHEVVAKEVLHATKYSYMFVEEDGKDFWIAIPRKEVEVGKTYYYMGGLLKRNFKSREYDRTFETIYLVSDVRSEPIFQANSAVERALAGTSTPSTAEAQASGHVHNTEDSVPLDELFENKDKYAGKNISVTGKCVKVNNAIMGRNWVHIQDGTASGDKPYDLTVTTSANVSAGSVITLTGTIVLNKDFGAGYKYDIIMENAHTH